MCASTETGTQATEICKEVGLPSVQTASMKPGTNSIRRQLKEGGDVIRNTRQQALPASSENDRLLTSESTTLWRTTSAVKTSFSSKHWPLIGSGNSTLIGGEKRPPPPLLISKTATIEASTAARGGVRGMSASETEAGDAVGRNDVAQSKQFRPIWSRTDPPELNNAPRLPFQRQSRPWVPKLLTPPNPALPVLGPESWTNNNTPLAGSTNRGFLLLVVC